MANEEISFSDLIASSIHDMKNSVNIQIHALERVTQQIKEKVEPDDFDALVSVIAQAHRMDANLIELLSLYKFGKSIYPLDISEHSVNDVIAEVLLQKASVFRFRGIAVDTVCDAACYWYFDRDLVAGVLLNALNNAYNYTVDKIRVVAKIEDNWLTLRIEDNGRGYPASMLQDGAVDADKRVNFFSGSTGLGFYFSSQVTQLHQNQGRCGSLAIENGGTYGGGCFVVRLP
ncbi:adaptive-response sensory-kinase SasA [mine drainage metagenome]|uniref:Adaptive-response sensory-kinase SasA n=1 Tax=mine drainage metagenome TaxID=410659 RepID=A0A1J5NYU9_9ZZZZ